MRSVVELQVFFAVETNTVDAFEVELFGVELAPALHNLAVMQLIQIRRQQ